MTPLPELPPSFRSSLRVFAAGNAGPFTLDGTHTYIVGRRRPAVIDPGPDARSHVRAVVRAVASAEAVTLLITHGHGDHAGALDAAVAGLREVGVTVRVVGSGHPLAREPVEARPIETDAGELHPVATPGHTPDHLAFHWAERSALFAGDLLLGRGDTTWVAGYRGCVADYLASLERVRALAPRVIFPTHGPPLTRPQEALERFEGHRRARIAQVRDALEAHPHADAEELVDLVYGNEVPPGLRGAALESVRALLDHVGEGGAR